MSEKVVFNDKNPDTILFHQNAPKADIDIVDRTTKEVVFILIINSSSDVLLNIRMVKPGSSIKVIALIKGTNDQLIRLKSYQHHSEINTKSNLLVKSVLDQEASFIFDGVIKVDKKAQKTDAYQRSESLLLSPKVKVESKPTLEILANDVRCTHGATISPVNHEHIWYLGTRGLPELSARKLLVAGFMESALIGLNNKRYLVKAVDILNL